MLEYNVLLKKEKINFYIYCILRRCISWQEFEKSAERVKYLVIRLPSQIKRVQEAGLQILEELEQL